MQNGFLVKRAAAPRVQAPKYGANGRNRLGPGVMSADPSHREPMPVNHVPDPIAGYFCDGTFSRSRRTFSYS